MEIEEFQPLVHIMFQTDHLVLLQKVYEWSIVDANDIDDTRYTTSKKLSEVGNEKECLVELYIADSTAVAILYCWIP